MTARLEQPISKVEVTISYKRTFVDDLSYALRRVRRQPVTLAFAAGMLGIGIGLTTAMFTVTDSLMLRPVPFRDAQRLASLSMLGERGGATTVSAAVLQAWRSSPGFESVEGASAGTSLMQIGDSLVARKSARVSPNLLRMLGVRPLRGRLFSPDEGRAGTDGQVLLSEDVWKTTFGWDPELIGKRITIDDQAMLVIGILPADFRFPDWDTKVWMPVDYQAPSASLATTRPIAYVRFAPGIPEPDALRLATEAAHKVDPATQSTRALARPLAGVEIDEYYARAMPVLLGGVGLLAVVLCGNVCLLLIGEKTTRRHEFGICTALGLSRYRLFRQALAESTIIGALGSLAGLALAWLLVDVASGFLYESLVLRTLNPPNLDFRALVALSASSVIATIASGLFPAWLSTRLDPAAAMKASERNFTDSPTARHATRVLLFGEIALACVLLVGMTLLVRSFIKLNTVDRGLDTTGVVAAWVNLPRGVYPNEQSRLAAVAAIENEIRDLPGIRQVAFSVGQPPRGGATYFGKGWRSDVAGAAELDMTVSSYGVGADFFDLYGINILRGRTFRVGEPQGNVIAGERLAEKLWPDSDPIGRSFQFNREQFHVVGLAEEITLPTLNPNVDRPEFYRPFVAGGGNIWVHLRCSEACPDVAVIRKHLLSTVPGAQIAQISAVEEAFDEQLARPRAAAALAFIFASVAIIVVAGGLFSVQSYAVSCRRREFGIRIALGASSAQIHRLVLRDGLTLTILGLGAGGIGAWSLSNILASLYYGVTLTDTWNWIVVCGTLAITMAVASWYPTRQASRINPATLLKTR